MRSSRWTVLLTVLLVGLLMLSACAPRANEGEVAAAESDLAIDLPALVLDIQEDGTLTVAGQPLSELGAVVGQDLSALSLPQDAVKAMIDNGIQHIQIDTSPEGLLILINGKAIPSLGWDGETLVTTAELLEQFGVAPVALLDRILPLIRNLGLGVILRVPVPEGVEPLPLVSMDTEAAEQAMSAQQEFLQAVLIPPTVTATVRYAPDGTWEMGDISVEEMDALVPGWGTGLTMKPGFLQAMKNMGISELGISTNENGFFISINGKKLPYIRWADGRINNVLDLAVQTGMLGDKVAGTDTEVLLQYVDQLLPSLLASQINLKVEFPQ